MSTLRRIIRNDQDIDEQAYLELFSAAILERDSKHLLPVLLAALSAKPLNLRDMLSFVRFIHQQTPKRSLSLSHKAVNIVGTGGGLPTFNISTTATFVAAAAGATVIKSGSYSYNSQCGSLDLLQHLGFNLKQDEQTLQGMLETLNIGFVSPGMYSPVLKRMAVSIVPFALRDIGGFINTLGPLLCPFQVAGQICGVRSPQLVDVFAETFAQLGMDNVLVASSAMGLDEFSAVGKNIAAHVNRGNIERWEFDPGNYAMHHHDVAQLKGGAPADNAALLIAILQSGGPAAARDTVILNAAHLLMLAGTCEQLPDALATARDALLSGAAYRLLHRAVEYSQDCATREPA